MKAKLSDIGKIGLKEIIEVSKQENPRDNWRNLEGFNVISLGDWLELCEKSGVDYVMATKVASIEIDKFLKFADAPNGEQAKEFRDLIEKVKEPNTMLRWDCCAPLSVKMQLQNGHSFWCQELLDGFSPLDPRAYEMIYEYPGNTMDVWKRPWIRAQHDGTHPIEYRVFVYEGEIVGVSNYYPQRPLELNMDDINTCMTLARRLIDNLTPPIKFQSYGTETWGSDSRSATMDFIKTTYNHMLFLEGGPPYGMSGSPCCFPNIERSEWIDVADEVIDGVPIAISAKEEIKTGGIAL